MSYVKPDTMRKKYLGNIETIDKKIAAIDDRAEKDKATLIVEKEFIEETLKRFDAIHPPKVQPENTDEPGLPFETKTDEKPESSSDDSEQKEPEPEAEDEKATESEEEEKHHGKRPKGFISKLGVGRL